MKNNIESIIDISASLIFVCLLQKQTKVSAFRSRNVQYGKKRYIVILLQTVSNDRHKIRLALNSYGDLTMLHFQVLLFLGGFFHADSIGMLHNRITFRRLSVVCESIIYFYGIPFAFSRVYN